MLLSITSTSSPATDLGYLLFKNPARVHGFDLSFGKATVFYPEATAERCTLCLLLSSSKRANRTGTSSTAGAWRKRRLSGSLLTRALSPIMTRRPRG
jgi:hypothetical protein